PDVEIEVKVGVTVSESDFRGLQSLAADAGKPYGAASLSTPDGRRSPSAETSTPSDGFGEGDQPAPERRSRPELQSLILARRNANSHIHRLDAGTNPREVPTYETDPFRFRLEELRSGLQVPGPLPRAKGRRRASRGR